jgi:alkylation response protein AidB-like acyl-CoA dehydrogenase
MSAASTAPQVSVGPGSPELRALLSRVAAGAFAREQEAIAPYDVIEEIRAARLGALRVPVAEGGSGASLRELFTVLIDLAHADANVAHILRAHYWFVELRLLDVDPKARSRWRHEVARGAIFGNAASEVGGSRAVGEFVMDTRLRRIGDQLRCTGVKYYSTGSRYSDYVVVYATSEPDDERIAALVLPIDRDGLMLDDDWDGIGQRLTATGTTRLENVLVDADEVILRPAGPAPDEPPEPSYIGAFLQLYLTAVIAGVARSVRDDAGALVRGRARTYSHAAATVASQDPQLQQTVGEIASYAFAAEATVLAAADALDAAAESVRDGLPDGALARLASLRAAEAKVVVDAQAQRIAALLFDVGGASATKQSHNLDRHWRNVRTLASHNPALYKARAIGDHVINGAALPQNGFF